MLISGQPAWDQAGLVWLALRRFLACFCFLRAVVQQLLLHNSQRKEDWSDIDTEHLDGNQNSNTMD